jgi:hypothetical protein
MLGKMSPFLQFRLWARSAPAAERLLVALSALVVAGLVGWALVPAGSSPTTVQSFSGQPQGGGSPSAALPGSTPGTTSAGGGPGTATGTGPSSPTGAAAGQSSAPGGGGSAGPAGSTGAPASALVVVNGQPLPAGCGTSAARNQAIRLGLPILDIAGPAVNSAFNIPSPSEQQNDWTAILYALNASGGVDCHPLVADFQTMNPADSTSGQTDCLQFVSDKVFAVLGYLSANATPGTGGDLCVAQHRIPDFHPQAVPADEAAQYYPYMFGMERTDILFANFVSGARRIGQFSPGAGFTRLGVVYSDCQTSLERNFLSDLAQAGISGAKLDTFDLGCPSGYAAPSVLEQAVLQFKAHHVSTVTFEEPGDPDLPDFTRVAASQLFTPHYLMPDDGLLLDTDHNTNGPDPNNFNGAVAITPNQYGALDTSPPVPVSPATAACDKALTAKGLPDTEHSSGGVAGVDCDLAWMLVSAATHAPILANDELAAGLQRAGSVPFAYPIGPNEFNSTDSTTGGEYWRPVQFHGSCSCWAVTGPTFNPTS